jgi:hypothetical protein
MNLEKGKWYKNLGYKNDYIAKYLDDYDNSNDKWISEYITDKKEYRNKRGTICFKNAVLIDQNELNKYLPLGHPDYKNIQIIEIW